MGIETKLPHDFEILPTDTLGSAESRYQSVVFGFLEETRNERIRAHDFLNYYHNLGYDQKFQRLWTKYQRKTSPPVSL
jgi:hypothetical protein